MMILISLLYVLVLKTDWRDLFSQHSMWRRLTLRNLRCKWEHPLQMCSDPTTQPHIKSRLFFSLFFSFFFLRLKNSADITVFFFLNFLCFMFCFACGMWVLVVFENGFLVYELMNYMMNMNRWKVWHLTTIPGWPHITRTLSQVQSRPRVRL